MKLPPNFTQSMYHWFDTPTSIYHWLHKSKNGLGRTVGTFRNLGEMEYWLSQDKFDDYDHYLSPYAFKTYEEGHKNYVGHRKALVETAIVNKIYSDFDPKEGETDCIYLLPKLRKLQSIIPSRIIFSGRGYQAYQDLSEIVSLEIAKMYQEEICRQFDLDIDPAGSPITNLHVMRMPYTRNSKTGRWALVVRDRMSENDVEYWSRQENLKYCYFKMREPISIKQLEKALKLA